MESIESFEQWAMLAVVLTDHGYHLRQAQYDTQYPEGFYVWFRKFGKPDIEVVTHNDTVHDAIIKFKAK